MDALNNNRDDEWFTWSPWLFDTSKYTTEQPVLLSSIPGTCTFSAAHHDELIDANFTEAFPVNAAPLAWANIFHVIEWHKERLRVITHSFDANQQQFPHLVLPSIMDVRLSVHEGPFTICLDMASWFSQFPLSEGVSNYMAYKYNDKTYRWTRLAMGHRPACHIAQAALERLATRARSSAHVVCFVDNIKFTGTAKQCIDACLIFLEDCAKVGATVNELVECDIANWSALSDKEKLIFVESQLKSTVTFLGLDLDHTNKTSRVAKKTIDKATQIWNLRHHWSLHDFNAFVSLLSYTNYASNTPMVHHYEVLAFNRLVAQAAAFTTDRSLLKKFWSKPFPHEWLNFLTPHLNAWLDSFISQGPVACPTNELLPFDSIFFIDSCGTAAGLIAAFADDKFTPQTKFFKWPSLFQHSTTSEPRGIALIAELFPAQKLERCLIVSDHTPAVAALNRGHGKSKENNDMVQALATTFPNAAFRSIHLPGWLMPADPISREEPLTKNGIRSAVLNRFLNLIQTGGTGLKGGEKKAVFNCLGLIPLDYQSDRSRLFQAKCLSEFLCISLEEVIQLIIVDDPHSAELIQKDLVK
jgi:hypothetical protein